MNAFGRVVAWESMNVNDKRLNSLVEPFISTTIVLADAWRNRDGIAEKMKSSKKGTWNERMARERGFLFGHRHL